VGETINLKNNDGRIGVFHNEVGNPLIVQNNVAPFIRLRHNNIGLTGGGSLLVQDNTTTGSATRPHGLVLKSNRSNNNLNCTGKRRRAVWVGQHRRRQQARPVPRPVTRPDDHSPDCWRARAAPRLPTSVVPVRAPARRPPVEAANHGCGKPSPTKSPPTATPASAATAAPPNGWTDFRTRTLKSARRRRPAQAVKTLAHDFAHVQLHDPGSFTGTTADCRCTAEVEAEPIAYLVAGAHGMPTDDYTFPYVATRAASSTNPDQVIAHTADRVVATARHIIDSTDLVPDRLEATPTTRALDRTVAELGGQSHPLNTATKKPSSPQAQHQVRTPTQRGGLTRLRRNKAPTAGLTTPTPPTPRTPNI
jgi:hypothetical protein